MVRLGFAACFTVLAAVNCCVADDLKNVRVRLVNGSSIRATIDAIDADGAISGSSNLDGKNLESITGINTGREVNSASAAVEVVLNYGGRVRCSAVQAAGDTVNAVFDGDSQELPVDVVRGVIWKDSEKVRKTLEDPSNQNDAVVVSSRKGVVVVRGLLERIDESHVYIDYNGKSRKISIEKVHAVVMAVLGDIKKPTLGFATTFLVDGSTIAGRIKSFSDGVLKVGLSGQFEIEIATPRISRIDVQSSSVVYLSDLQPESYEEQTQFVLPRTWQRDKSLLGNKIQLKYFSSGRVVGFDKGVGTRSYTSLVFRNSGEFTHLRTVVGIDSETGGNGDCEMVGEGDGIRLWSKRVTGTTDPEPIVVDIKGIENVALIVLPGANFDLADHAVWADAKFTKSE
jgi:hypothetical protein